jgi:hypothetical protein
MPCKKCCLAFLIHLNRTKLSPGQITYPKYTMGSSLYINPYHVSIIQTKLTRTVTDFIPSLREEIMTVLDDLIPPQENGADLLALYDI